MDTGYVKVQFKNVGELRIKKGTTVKEAFYDEYIKGKLPLVVGARVSNIIRQLDFILNSDCEMELLDLKTSHGIRIYKRSLILIFIKAVGDLFPNSKTRILHSINKGVYCEVELGKKIEQGDVEIIEEKMKKIIEVDAPIEHIVVSKEEAEKIFTRMNEVDKLRLLKSRHSRKIKLIKFGWLYEFDNEPIIPSTGFAGIFELMQYGKGIILRFPSKESPIALPPYVRQEKMGNVFEEHKLWLDILDVSNVSDLNMLIRTGEINEFIRVAEALHEKKIAQIADMIHNNSERIKLVTIAGPSSSGKTTFSKRLSIQLRVNGLRPLAISLDDYFLNREQTPRDEKGEYDFEAIEALDLDLFNHNLQSLLKGEETELPLFNFHTGCREPIGRKVRMESDQIIVIEGIHGLNEKLTKSIPRNNKFKIYISPLAQLNIDNHTRISTTDLRFIRRIVRDFKYRSSSAANTIKLWPSVRRGEEKNIFPFQEQADIIFNSALTYEIAIFKKYALPLLKEIKNSEYQFAEAQRLMHILDFFLSANSKVIPNNSIIREFIGGSCFE